MSPQTLAARRLLGPATSRCLVAGLLASLAFFAVSAVFAFSASAAAPPRDFVGTQSFADPTDAELNRLGANNVRLFRAQMNWASVEAQRPSGCSSGTSCTTHTYSWGRYDRMFANAAKRGVRVMPVLLGSPAWAVGTSKDRQRFVPVEGKPGYAPWKRQAFYAFAKAAAKRYGSAGTFWKGKSYGTTAVRARYWQVWNEPNLPSYWWYKPNVAEYRGLLNGTGPALRAGDPSALVVSAGLPWSNQAALTPPAFIEKLFDGGGKADSVAIHPYGKTPDSVMTGLRAARSALNRTPMKLRTLWLTEFGWASSGPSSTFRVSSSTQARYLRETYRKLFAARSSYGVKGAIWFNLKDRRPPAGQKDAWYYHTGLFTRSGTPKPSWTAMKCVTTGRGC